MTDVSFFRRVALFEQLPDAALLDIASRCETLQFRRGDLVCKENQRGEVLFLISSGLVQVHVDDGRGGRRVLTHLQRGDHFGEMALFTGAPRTASVEALSDVSLLALRKADMEACIQRNPSVAWEIIRTLCLRLAEANVSSVPSEKGSITVVTSPDRGIGRSSLSLNLAAAVADAGSSRVVVYDPQLSNVDLARLTGGTKTSQIAQELLCKERVDLDACLREVQRGVFVLRPQEGDRLVPLKELHHFILFNALRDRFDHVIVDSSLILAAVNRHMMQQANHIVLLLSPHTSEPKSYLETFRRMVLERNDVDPEKVLYGLAEGLEGEGDFFENLGDAAELVGFRFRHCPETLASVSPEEPFFVRARPEAELSRTVTELAHRLVFDQTVELPIPEAPGRSALRERLMAEGRALFEETFHGFEELAGEEEGFRAWTNTERLDAVLHAVTEFVGKMKEAFDLERVQLRINDRSIWV